MAPWDIFVVLKTAAGGSTGVNRARGRRVTIMKSNTENVFDAAKSPVSLISRC